MDDRFKFRVWCKDLEKYVDNVNLLPIGALCFAGSAFGFADDNYVVEQCTGLKDKNGNLIYEGDIIKDRGEITYKIQWKDACFFAVSLDKFNYLPDCMLVQAWLNTWKAEIVGNIHENKGEK